MTREQAASGRTTSWWQDLVVVTLYLLLTVAMTWPLTSRLTTHFAGRDVDAWINPWATWWTEKVVSEGFDLYETPMLFYPHGVSLAFHSFIHVTTALALLFRPWLGNLGAHNATVVLAYGLSGYGMFCLARYVTRSSLAAFFAGLVFAFFPYRMDESSHPGLSSNQWMPLYLLFLAQLLKEERKKYVIPAAIFFVLNALTGWHLMTLVCLLSAAYLGYLLVIERWRLSRATIWNLVLLAALIGAILAPLFYPIAREHLTAPSAYIQVPLEKGKGNDLIAFFLPSKEHPIWGKLVRPLCEQIKSQRSAYLGFTVIGLSVIAALMNWRQARFWIAVGVASMLLSIGPYLQINGQQFEVLVPWSVPIVSLLRHPFRFMLLVGFALSLTSGLGLAALLGRPGNDRRRKQWTLAGAAIALLIVEYLCLPFPTTAATVHEQYFALAKIPGDGAILDLPMGRHRSKPYMYYQIVHGRPIVEGHVSRTPQDAYAFIEADPTLRSINACGDWGLPPADLAPLLSSIKAHGIDYVILHKDLVTPASLDLWLKFRSIPPDYADEQIAVYDTQIPHASTAAQPQLLESCVAVRALGASPLRATQGEVVEIPLEWTAGVTPQEDYILELALSREQDAARHTYRYQVMQDLSIATWPRGWQQTLTYLLPINSVLAPGLYHVQARLLPTERTVADVLSAHVVNIEVLAPSAGTAAAPTAEATFGQDLRLHGYNLEIKPDVLHLTLHWQALRQMAVDYKIFIHLHKAESGALVAQADTMPRQWSYPTSWWTAREVVFDTMTLPVDSIPSGKYYLAIGVYDSLTGERLDITDSLPNLSIDGRRLILPDEITR